MFWVLLVIGALYINTHWWSTRITQVIVTMSLWMKAIRGMCDLYSPFFFQLYAYPNTTAWLCPLFFSVAMSFCVWYLMETQVIDIGHVNYRDNIVSINRRYRHCHECTASIRNSPLQDDTAASGGMRDCNYVSHASSANYIHHQLTSCANFISNRPS